MQTRTDLNFIGQLDTRIKIIERVRSTSASGAKTFVATEFGSGFWAKVKDVSGTESEDQKIIALNVRKYIIRYNPDLILKKITDLYIEDGDSEYNIYAFSLLGRKKFIELKCSKSE
jgi:hypothetical protein